MLTAIDVISAFVGLALMKMLSGPVCPFARHEVFEGPCYCSNLPCQQWALSLCSYMLASWHIVKGAE